MLNDNQKFDQQNFFIVLILANTVIDYHYQNFKILTSYLIAVLAFIT